MLECLPSFKCQVYLSNYVSTMYWLKWRKNLIFGAMTMNLCSDFLPIVLIIHSLDWITVTQSGWIKYVFKSLKYSKYILSTHFAKSGLHHDLQHMKNMHMVNYLLKCPWLLPMLYCNSMSKQFKIYIVLKVA